MALAHDDLCQFNTLLGNFTDSHQASIRLYLKGKFPLIEEGFIPKKSDLVIDDLKKFVKSVRANSSDSLDVSSEQYSQFIDLANKADCIINKIESKREINEQALLQGIVVFLVEVPKLVAKLKKWEKAYKVCESLKPISDFIKDNKDVFKAFAIIGVITQVYTIGTLIAKLASGKLDKTEALFTGAKLTAEVVLLGGFIMELAATCPSPLIPITFGIKTLISIIKIGECIKALHNADTPEKEAMCKKKLTENCVDGVYNAMNVALWIAVLSTLAIHPVVPLVLATVLIGLITAKFIWKCMKGFMKDKVKENLGQKHGAGQAYKFDEEQDYNAGLENSEPIKDNLNSNANSDLEVNEVGEDFGQPATFQVLIRRKQ